jgi:hypothetical protein
MSTTNTSGATRSMATTGLAMALIAPAVHAARPLATEDAGVLARGECEWESVGTRLQTEPGATAHAWSTQLACGAGGQTQLALGYAHTKSIASHDQALIFSGKSGLVDGGNEATSVAIAYGVNLLRTATTTFRLDATSLNLAVSRPLGGALTAHANLGWLHTVNAPRNTATWNLALEHSLAGGVDIGGEVYGDSRTSPMLGVGLRWTITSRLNLNASFATQSGDDHARLFTVGTKWAF